MKVNNLYNIRFGTLADLPAIVDIYNQAIRSKRSTGDTQEFALAERMDWFNKFDQNSHPIYIIESKGNVFGYATLSPYRPGRQAMSRVAELSYYLNFDLLAQGAGTALIKHVILDCKRLKINNLLAILLDINIPSIEILQKFEFQRWGHLPKIIDMDGEICGHLIYGLKI